MTAPLTGPFRHNALGLLQIAIDFWRDHGATYVDLPWLVEKEYADATRPAGRGDVQSAHGHFVSSGEVSFLKLWAEGLLPDASPGPYIGWTPCLRDEEVIDPLHQHGFMKAEWFAPVAHLDDAGQAARFVELTFRQHLCFQVVAAAALGCPRGKTPTTVLDPQGIGMVDLTLAGIEVGSYGVRTFRGKAYIYGTALALPRFQQALDRLSLS